MPDAWVSAPERKRAIVYDGVASDDRHTERRTLGGQIEMGRKDALDNDMQLSWNWQKTSAVYRECHSTCRN